MSTPVFKDVTGASLQADDCIVYSALDGRSAVLRFAIVLEVTQAKDAGFYTGKRIPKIRVQGVEVDSWERGGFRLQSKPVFLSYENRVIRVDRKDVPAGALKKLVLAMREGV